MLTTRVQVITIGCLLIVLVAPTESSAAKSIATLFDEAVTKYSPMAPDDIMRAREKLRTDVGDLRRLLSLTPENVEGWEEYLKLRELERNLNSPQANSIAKLQEVASRFSSDQVGLGRHQFVVLRNDLKFYLTLLQDAPNPDADKQFAFHVAGLRSAINNYDQEPQIGTFNQIAAHIGWLVDRRQADELVQAVRNRYSHSNLHVSLSEELISSAIVRDVDVTTPFTASLKGATVSGNARTRGTVTAALVPNEDRASVAISFEGNSVLEIVVNRDPVQAYATGAVSVTANSRIDVDGNGVTTVRPRGSANANVNVYCIQTNLPWPVKPLVTRFARRVIRKQQTNVDRSAAESAERELESQMQKQINEIVDPLNQQYLQDVVYRLRRIDAFPASIQASTTKERLNIDLLLASNHQLAAPTEVSTRDSDADLSIWLHQSAVNNFASSMFGGKTFTVREIQELAESLLGIPLPSNPVSTAEEISIRFDDDRPLVLQVDQDSITLSITGQEFVSNRRTYPAMAVSITYAFARAASGFQATLVGDPLIVPPRLLTAERKSLSLRETAIRRILRNRLTRDLNKRVDIDQIPLPPKLNNMPSLSVTQLTSENGWLTVGASRQPAKPYGE